MNKLKKLGFKKVPGTEPGFHMYELTPAKLQAFDENFKPQAASEPRTEKRPSVQARKRTSLTSKQIWDIVGHMKGINMNDKIKTKTGWWSINIDFEGEVSDDTLNHISDCIKNGFTQGQIIEEEESI